MNRDTFRIWIIKNMIWLDDILQFIEIYSPIILTWLLILINIGIIFFGSYILENSTSAILIAFESIAYPYFTLRSYLNSKDNTGSITLFGSILVALLSLVYLSGVFEVLPIQIIFFSRITNSSILSLITLVLGFTFLDQFFSGRVINKLSLRLNTISLLLCLWFINSMLNITITGVEWIDLFVVLVLPCFLYLLLFSDYGHYHISNSKKDK